MNTFEELGIKPEIIKAISEIGFENPMPVQEEVIPYLLGEENDVIALAQTGTGKTAAFGLPLIQKIDVSNKNTQALILSPTRELCLQIADDLKDYSKYINGLKVLAVYGGSSIESQIKSLKRGVHIIVATPGRLIDLINRKCAKLENISNVVMDEADEMLNMGFTDDIDEILSHAPKQRNTLLFSATMPKEIYKITKKYMDNPHEITIGRKNEGAENVKHIYYMVHAKDKYLTLKRIADFYPNIYGIVFCRTRRETQEIADKLIKDGYSAEALHGDLSQSQRDYVMNKFRLKSIQILVATDVAARGLDVNNLTHVINYGLPDDTESYTHRSGRTGRAGKAGISISIIHTKEKGKIKPLEKILNKKFEVGSMPSGKDICEKQVFHFIDKIEKEQVNEEEIEGLLPNVYRKLEWLSKEDLIKRVISQELNRLIDYYQDAEEISVVSGSRREGRESNSGPEEGYSKIFISLGKMDGIKPGNLMEIINDCFEKKIKIGKIDLFTRYSMFDVEEAFAKQVVSKLKDLNYLGRNIKIDFATKEQMEKMNSSSGRRSGGSSFSGRRSSGNRRSSGGYDRGRRSDNKRRNNRSDRKYDNKRR